MSEIERDLPELSDESVLRIERAVMDDIGRERQTARTRAKKRRGWVGAGLAAAAVVAGAIVIVPVVQQNGLSGAYDSASGGAAEQAAPESADAEAAVETERQVIRTGTASIVVDDVQAATDALSDLADEHGGYVEGLGSSGDEDSGTRDTGGSPCGSPRTTWTPCVRRSPSWATSSARRCRRRTSRDRASTSRRGSIRCRHPSTVWVS